jgi:hypothetical protein
MKLLNSINDIESISKEVLLRQIENVISDESGKVAK